MWFWNNDKQLERKHLERMKCLEQGLPLPDAELAWVEATQLRGSQVTAVMIIGTLGLLGVPVGATAILFALGRNMAMANVILPLLLALIWSVCGGVLYTLLQSGLRTLAQVRQPPAHPDCRSNGSAKGLERLVSERIQQGLS